MAGAAIAGMFLRAAYIVILRALIKESWEFLWIFFFLLLGRYALVAFRKVNFNQIPKIIPKIPVQ